MRRPRRLCRKFGGGGLAGRLASLNGPPSCVLGGRACVVYDRSELWTCWRSTLGSGADSPDSICSERSEVDAIADGDGLS